MSKDTYITQSSSVQSRYVKHKTMVAQMYKETALPDVITSCQKTLTLPNLVAYNLGTLSIKQWHLTQQYKETTLPDKGNFMSRDTYITQSSSVQSRYIKHKTMASYSVIQRNSIARYR